MPSAVGSLPVPLLVRDAGGELGQRAGHRSISVGVYSRAAEVPYVKERRGRAVKKLLLVALAAIGGLLVYRQIQADRAEQDLWTEATDSVPTGS
ncbi:hypothetical protein SSP24_58370 [Streptomyces spinoverrucosus]|uniref:Uncharacterized protein n=1 Tax=Streptomyces spinoverrucosus TaxID=284043 RepID=A0A4Y3VME2_9ACTN|nr:hypothetical protein SSP24_58370 [Streptomyces spinoverrucosus]GHB62961.1 hypothetical protein GCM10010397_36280 [Streptomyces spinoverrucosus]